MFHEHVKKFSQRYDFSVLWLKRKLLMLNITVESCIIHGLSVVK